MSIFFSKPKPKPVEEAPMIRMQVINGYEMEGDFRNISGGARWDSAVKDGKRWFVKEFMSPVYPQSGGEDYVRSCQEACMAFYTAKNRLYEAVRSSDTGTLVPVCSFFRWGARYYAVSPWVDMLSPDIGEVAARSDKEKLLLLRVLANTLAALHRNHVVHADLRLDNVVFKRSPSGSMTLKLIDFDSSFLEDAVPEPEDLAISPAFVSPEVARMALTEESEPISCRSDVFSAGLLFHYIWCGEGPGFDETKYDYPFEAVLDGETLSLSSRLDDTLRELIAAMLSCESSDRPTMAEVFERLKGNSPAAVVSAAVKPVRTVIEEGGVKVTERSTVSGLKITTSF